MILVPCPECDGRGQKVIQPLLDTPMDHKKPVSSVICQTCYGTGRITEIEAWALKKRRA